MNTRHYNYKRCKLCLRLGPTDPGVPHAALKNTAMWSNAAMTALYITGHSCKYCKDKKLTIYIFHGTLKT